MGKQKHTEAVTPFAKLRLEYNEKHSKTISQKDMGNIAHVSKSTISRIENGEVQPKPEVIKSYSDYFNVSTDYFLPQEQIKDKIPDSATPVREIGITEDVVNTYKMIDEFSKPDYNLLAVLNSLVGNDVHTLTFLNNILDYLVSQQTNNCNNLIKKAFVDNMLQYIDYTMKPQLQKVVKRTIDWNEQISYINTWEDK